MTETEAVEKNEREREGGDTRREGMKREENKQIKRREEKNRAEQSRKGTDKR